MHADPIRPFNRTLDFTAGTDYSILSSICRLHQTKRAANGVRTHFRSQEDLVQSDAGVTSATVHGRILAEMHSVLREAEEGHAIGTGLERQARISGSSTIQTTGNTFNAALTAGQRGTAVCIKSIWQTLHLTCS